MNNQNPSEILQLLPQLAQSIYSDGAFHFSGNAIIATDARLQILKHNINLIKESIAKLEKLIN